MTTASSSKASAVAARLAVGEAVIDLVRDEPQAEGLAGLAEPPQGLAADHRAGRVGRAHGENPGEGFGGMQTRHAVGGHDPAIGAGQRDRRGLELERRQDVAIGRIARRRDGDASAGIEQRQEREDEPRRRAGRDDHPLRRHRDPVSLPVMAGDPLAQGGEPERLRVADAPVGERRPGRLAGPLRRRRRRLAHLHMNDAVPSPFFCRGRG